MGVKNSLHIFLFTHSKYRPQEQVEVLLFLYSIFQMKQKFSFQGEQT